MQVRNNGAQRDIFRSVDSAADGYSTRSEIRLVSERKRCGGLIGVVVPGAVLYFDGSAYALAALVFLGWSASGTMPLLMGTIPSEIEVLGGVGAPALAR